MSTVVWSAPQERCCAGASEQAAEKQRFVQQLFTTIAPRYDWFNRLASCGLDQRWRKHALVESELGTGMDVLDVCTGTGDLALLCADRVGREGLVVGLDANEAMLRGALEKRSHQGAVSWLQGDAHTLPFASHRFDRVVIGFSTRNLSHLGTGLREMVRVLKPDGRLVVLETGRPAHRVVRAGYWLFLHTVARSIGWVLTGRCWPFTYLAKSVKAFLSPPEFVALLETCGTQARYVPLSWGLASLYVARKVPA